MNIIDNFLNKITMYRLLLYFLIALEVLAIVLSLFGVLPYSVAAISGSAIFLVVVCFVTNLIFARVFRVTPNIESAYITALILALIISPGLSVHNLFFLFWAGVWAMASKFMLNLYNKHVFNPAAIAVVITGYFLGQYASWWVGTVSMLPVVFLGGVLIIRKIHRADLVWSFLIAATFTVATLGFLQGSNPLVLLQKTMFETGTFFFASVMLTEPLTAPPTRWLQIIYGILVGILYAPQFHVGSFYLTPELALVIGNVFAFLVSPKLRLVLRLEERLQLGPDIVDFLFRPSHKVAFAPGQYMEWTLDVPEADDRGNRRYFTLASSPTEDTIRLGVKFYPEPSRFKQILSGLQPGGRLIAGQLSGNFTLPKDRREKCVFIAGGIGVTPFRSMIKYLVDKGEQRDIVLLYSNKVASEVVYTDVFAQAAPLGVRTVYTLTEQDKVPADWPGRVGMLDQAMLVQEVPDYKDRTFYLSGPHGMVVAFEKLLAEIGVPRQNIRVDYFPGFA